MNNVIVKTDRELVRHVINWLSFDDTSMLSITQDTKNHTRYMIFLKNPQEIYPIPDSYKVLCMTGDDEKMDKGTFTCVGIWLEDKRLLFTFDTMPSPFNKAYTMNSQVILCDKVLAKIKKSLAFRTYYKYQQKYPNIGDIPKDIPLLHLEDPEVKNWFGNLMEWQYVNDRLANTGKDFYMQDVVTLPALDIVSPLEVIQYVVGDTPKVLYQITKNLTKEKEKQLLKELMISYLWDKAVQAYTPSKRAFCAKKIANTIKEYKQNHPETDNELLLDIFYEDDEGIEYHLNSYVSYLKEAPELYKRPVLLTQNHKIFVLLDKEGKKFTGHVENIKEISQSGTVIYERE